MDNLTCIIETIKQTVIEERSGTMATSTEMQPGVVYVQPIAVYDHQPTAPEYDSQPPAYSS